MVVRRSTDYGTVILHAVLVIAFLELVATGLRIAADDPESIFLAVLDPVLPSEQPWYRHLVGAVALISALAGYVVYVRSSRLGSRVRLDRARLLLLLNAGRQRWAAMNVIVLWVLLISLMVEVVTGLLLFAGVGGAILDVHRDVTWLCVAAVILHIALHALFGGWQQILRMIRPGPLIVPEPEPDFAVLLAEHLARNTATAAGSVRQRADQQETGTSATDGRGTLNAHPVVSATAMAIIAASMAVGAEQITRPVLEIPEIPSSEAPILDGDLSDPVWSKSKPVRVLTTQGGDFGGVHESLVEIRAVHDDLNAYFAISWDDPTRSLKHLPLVKRNGIWHIVASNPASTNEQRYCEDKFAILLSRSAFPLIGEAIHLGQHPLAGKPSGATGRGLHYTSGSVADVIVWRASHGGPSDYIENAHFGEPSISGSNTADSPYAGGFSVDDSRVPYIANAQEIHDASGRSLLVPARLPRDLGAVALAMGRIVDGDGQSDGAASRWWMTNSESVPYSIDDDAKIPDGAVLPGVIVTGDAPATPSSVRGRARWAAGRWTLELARRLYTGSPFDVPIKSGTLLWVAAFDHDEKRHTRHLRPFRLEVE